MAFMLDEHQVAVEGAAATTAGLMFSGKTMIKDESFACIITVRNVDTPVILNVCENKLF